MALSNHGLSVVENLSTSWARLRGGKEERQAKTQEGERVGREEGGGEKREEEGKWRGEEGRRGEEEGRRGEEEEGRDKERRGKKRKREEEERRKEYILSTH